MGFGHAPSVLLKLGTVNFLNRLIAERKNKI